MIPGRLYHCNFPLGSVNSGFQNVVVDRGQKFLLLEVKVFYATLTLLSVLTQGSIIGNIILFDNSHCSEVTK